MSTPKKDNLEADTTPEQKEARETASEEMTGAAKEEGPTESGLLGGSAAGAAIGGLVGGAGGAAIGSVLGLTGSALGEGGKKKRRYW